MTVVLLQLSVSLPMLLPVLQAAHFHAPSLAKRRRARRSEEQGARLRGCDRNGMHEHALFEKTT